MSNEKQPVWPFPIVSPTPRPLKKEDDRIYLVEVECGGSDASGGGCGGPVNLYQVSKEVFQTTPGQHMFQVTSHNEDEHNFDEERVAGVKLQFSPCSCCRNRL